MTISIDLKKVNFKKIIVKVLLLSGYFILNDKFNFNNEYVIIN